MSLSSIHWHIFTHFGVGLVGMSLKWQKSV